MPVCKVVVAGGGDDFEVILLSVVVGLVVIGVVFVGEVVDV